MNISTFILRPSRPYRIRTAYFKPNWPIIGEVLLIGMPSLAKHFSAGLRVVVTNNLLRLLGADGALGVYAIVNRLYAALLTPQAGIVQGM